MSQNPLFLRKTIPLIIVSWFLLTSCDVQDNSQYNDTWYESPTTYWPKTTHPIKICLSDNETKWLCVEKWIEQIKNKWLQECIVWNIDAKKELSDKLKDNSITNTDVNDILSLESECIYYKESKNISDNDNNSPVFWSFVSSMAWSFVWNYLANSMFSNYNNSKEKEQNYYSWSASGGSTYMGYSKTQTADKVSWNVNTSWWNTKIDSLNKVDTQVKTDTWNISKMRNSSSANNTNYKLGDTATKWASLPTKNTNVSKWSTTIGNSSVWNTSNRSWSMKSWTASWRSSWSSAG